jgi:hypothetical protein
MQNVQLSDAQKQENKVNKNYRLSSSNSSPPSSAAKVANSANNLNNNANSCKTMLSGPKSTIGPASAAASTTGTAILGPGHVPGQNANNNSTSSSKLQPTASSDSTPTKSDTETFSEFQPRVSDSSESDEEESVSEVIISVVHRFRIWRSVHIVKNEKELHTMLVT